jgi:hypothetical protein
VIMVKDDIAGIFRPKFYIMSSLIHLGIDHIKISSFSR